MIKPRHQQATEAHVKFMHEASAKEDWFGRCWNCRNMILNPQSVCPYCGANPLVRNAKTN